MTFKITQANRIATFENSDTEQSISSETPAQLGQDNTQHFPKQFRRDCIVVTVLIFSSK